jgi:hypothetical protein
LNNHHQPVQHFARPVALNLSASAAPEEVLVADARARLTPADMVERKLGDLLNRNPFTVGHLRMDVLRDRARLTSKTTCAR